MTDDIIRPLRQVDLPPAQALIAAVGLFALARIALQGF